MTNSHVLYPSFFGQKHGILKNLSWIKLLDWIRLMDSWWSNRTINTITKVQSIEQYWSTLLSALVYSDHTKKFLLLMLRGGAADSGSDPCDITDSKLINGWKRTPQRPTIWTSRVVVCRSVLLREHHLEGPWLRTLFIRGKGVRVSKTTLPLLYERIVLNFWCDRISFCG